LGRASALHLAEVIKLVGGQFIVETNGMAIGHDPSLLDFLKPLKCHIWRIIKGNDPDTLQKVTGACCGVPPLFDLIVPLNKSTFLCICIVNLSLSSFGTVWRLRMARKRLKEDLDLQLKKGNSFSQSSY